MKSSIEGIIFDMDGCLYPLDRGSGLAFGESRFGQSIKAQEIAFIQRKLDVDEEEAARVSSDIKDRFNRHLSLGLEAEWGIPRSEFFDATWDLQPNAYIDKQPNLLAVLGTVTVRSALLTAAPKVWADRVLEHLGVSDHFGDLVVSGDQDIRKPDPAAFQQAAALLGSNPQRTISIGDQEHTDILPAQSLGMTTVRIGNDTTTQADFLAPDITSAITLLRNEGFNI